MTTDNSDDSPTTIDCKIHGTNDAAIVCRHMLRPTDVILGFVENGADASDLQAWCDSCEAMFRREQGLTEAFREFNDFAVVCIACYARLKKQHSASKVAWWRWMRRWLR